MSKRKSAAIKAWESVLQSGTQQKQLDATERLLRQSWVLPLPVLAANPWVEPDGRWCEALVVAVSWTTAPGTPMSQAVLAIPGGAYEGESEDHLYMANLYLPGTGPSNSESVEEALIKLILMPGEYLVKRLGEAVPRSDPLVPFADALRAPICSAGRKSAHSIHSRFRGDGQDMRVTYGDEELGKELYHSVGEMDIVELREALVPPPTARRKGGAAAAAKADLLSGAPGGRKAVKAAGAVPDVPESGAPKPKVSSRPAQPASGSVAGDSSPVGNAELIAVIAELSSRLNSLETRAQASLAGWGPCPGRAMQPSLLDAGRVPPPGPMAREVAAGLGENAGSSAYRRTLAAARQLIGEGEEGAVETRGPARVRVSEEKVREQLMAGGMEGVQATQLAILETLERLQSGGRQHRDRGHDTLEDILWGLGGAGDQGASNLATDEGGDDSRGSSSKGLGGLTRLQAAMSRHPERCSALADQRAWKLLGSDISQTPWSMQLYAQQHIRFGRLETHQRMWDMLACFHSLARQRDWSQLDMKVTQCLKACEQSVQHGGSWKIAWLHTGIHDSRGNVLGNTGLAHPAELSLAVQVLKDQKALDEALRKAGAAGGMPNAPDGVPSGPAQRKPKAKGKGEAPGPEQ
eukprot:6490879-Amphidinium_carterae.4